MANYEPYASFDLGFDIGTEAAIDRRIYLTKAEMLTAEDLYMLPKKYFCICPDDGKIYLYDSNVAFDAATGRYRALESSIDFNTEGFKENFEEAVAGTQSLVNVKSEVEGLKPRVTAVEETLDTLTLDEIPGVVDGGRV